MSFILFLQIVGSTRVGVGLHIRNAINGGRAQGHGAIYLGQLGLDAFLTKAILLKLHL
jgi:hypothetical protein